MFETIFFGSRAEADAVLRIVRGDARCRQAASFPSDAGSSPAGTPYSAFDPELMLWTVAVIADSAKVFYELFIGHLDAAERDELWADYVASASSSGCRARWRRRSWAEFEEYFDARLALARGAPHRGGPGTGRAILFEIPVPALNTPAMRVHNIVMLGRAAVSRAAHVRAAVHAGRRARLPPGRRGLRAPRPLAPAFMRRGRNTRFFDQVANTERGRIASGKPTHQRSRFPG